jgi:hypothetical protein
MNIEHPLWQNRSDDVEQAFQWPGYFWIPVSTWIFGSIAQVKFVPVARGFQELWYQVGVGEVRG